MIHQRRCWAGPRTADGITCGHVKVMLSSNELFYGDFMSRRLETMRISHMVQVWKVCQALSTSVQLCNGSRCDCKRAPCIS